MTEGRSNSGEHGLFEQLAARQVDQGLAGGTTLRPQLPYVFDGPARGEDSAVIEDVAAQPPPSEPIDVVRHEIQSRSTTRESSGPPVLEPSARAADAIHVQPQRPAARRGETPDTTSGRTTLRPDGDRPAPLVAATPASAFHAQTERITRHVHTNERIIQLESRRLRESGVSGESRPPARPVPTAVIAERPVLGRRAGSVGPIAAPPIPPAETTIEIHIGRVDVRATTDATPRADTPRQTAVDDRLAAYLRRRGAGARS
jgi:hypothetical protein